MAVMASFDKNFEVEAISFSPNIITVGEKTNYSITIKNVSGRRINTMYATLRLYYRATDGKVYGSYDEYMVGSYPFKQDAVAWANGVTKTFTGSFTFTASNSYPPKIDTRLMPTFKGSDIGYPSDFGGNDRLGMMLSFTTDIDLGDGRGNSDVFFDLRGENSENLYVIDARYTPSILVFAAERSTGNVLDDEGENLLMNVQLKKSAAARPEYMSMYLNYRDRSKPDADPSSINLKSLIESALVSETQTVIAETLGKNSDWDLVLWFGDQYESVTATLLVSRAFANVHLSGSRSGGVCFGSFSKAVEGNPLFQCYYPSEFYAGIKGGFSYESGEVRTGGKWIDGRDIYRYVLMKEVTLSGRDEKIDSLPSKIGTLISTNGTLNNANGAAWPVTYAYHGGLTWNVSFDLDADGSINLRAGSSYSGTHTVVIILEYTKSTKEASL